MTNDLERLRQYALNNLNNLSSKELQSALADFSNAAKEAGQDLFSYMRENAADFVKKYPNSAKLLAAVAVYCGGQAMIKKIENYGIATMVGVVAGERAGAREREQLRFIDSAITSFQAIGIMATITAIPTAGVSLIALLLLIPIALVDNHNLSQLGDTLLKHFKNTLPAASLSAASKFFKSEDDINKITLKTVKEWAKKENKSDVVADCDKLLPGKELNNKDDLTLNKISDLIKNNKDLSDQINKVISEQTFVKDLFKSGLEGAALISAARVVLSSSQPLLAAGIMAVEEAIINHASQDKTIGQRVASAYEQLPSKNDMLAKAKSLLESAKDRVSSTVTSVFTVTPVQQNNEKSI